jgi:hypothetical protein
MIISNDSGLAALLVVAMESGLISDVDAIRLVYAELELQEEPAPWLIDASMARIEADLVSVLRDVALDHPALVDIDMWVDAARLALNRGRTPESIGARLLRIQWPDDLEGFRSDLDEAMFCAPCHGGPPADQALRAFLDDHVAAHGDSEWHDALVRLAG